MPGYVRSLIISCLLTAFCWLAAAGSAAAQSSDGDCTCRPFWQIAAAALLGAFIAVVVMLILTRWRRLINWRDHGE